MNTQQMKEDCEFCQQNGGVRLGVKIPEMLELIAAYEGAQFAAASHLRTVEQQAKIIAGMQAEPIQSGDASELIERLNDYANEPGYSHCDYADTMKQAAAALAQRGDVRNQALEEAAALCVALIEKHNVHSNFICANAIRALASTPSAAMQGQGVPTRLAFVATNLDGRADVGLTPEKAMERAGAGCDTIIPLYDLGDAAPTPPAAQPQAGGQELTDAEILELIQGYKNHEHNGRYMFYRPQLVGLIRHITGTKGATE